MLGWQRVRRHGQTDVPDALGLERVRPCLGLLIAVNGVSRGPDVDVDVHVPTVDHLVLKRHVFALWDFLIEALLLVRAHVERELRGRRNQRRVEHQLQAITQQQKITGIGKERRSTSRTGYGTGFSNVTSGPKSMEQFGSGMRKSRPGSPRSKGRGQQARPYPCVKGY